MSNFYYNDFQVRTLRPYTFLPLGWQSLALEENPNQNFRIPELKPVKLRVFSSSKELLIFNDFELKFI